MSADAMNAWNEMMEVLRRAPNGPPWIRAWGSLAVHGLGSHDVLADPRNVDLAVAAVNFLHQYARLSDPTPEHGEGCPDFPPGTVLRHHVDGTHTIVPVTEADR